MPDKLESIEQIKALVAGDLGLEMEKYPLKCATPAYFGVPPQPGVAAAVSSGSASLIRLSGQPFALTCWHVLEGYRQRRGDDANTIFQLGNCKLDPLAQLKCKDEGLDYALIGLSEGQVKELVASGGPFGEKFLVEPPDWPPKTIAVGDFVAFGGFPGALREALSFDKISFGSYSSGATRVAAVSEDRLVCQFEREHWIKHGNEPEPNNIRGMSGGPVFALRKSPVGVMSYEFVGHIFEFSECFELLYVRLASVITA